jgi:hypothetical protein
MGTRVACEGPPLGLPLKPPRGPPIPDGRPLFLRGVPDSEALPVPGSGVSQSGRGRVGGRPLPRLRGIVWTTGGLLRSRPSWSSSTSCSPSSSSAPSCSTWLSSWSSSSWTIGSGMSSSDTSTLTAGVEFPKAWVSMDGRKSDDELYVLADNRSLGPPSLPLPRGIASTCTMLMVARASISVRLAH